MISGFCFFFPSLLCRPTTCTTNTLFHVKKEIFIRKLKSISSLPPLENCFFHVDEQQKCDDSRSIILPKSFKPGEMKITELIFRRIFRIDHLPRPILLLFFVFTAPALHGVLFLLNHSLDYTLLRSCRTHRTTLYSTKKMDQALPLTRDFILYVFWRIIREEHEEKSY